MVNMDQSLLLLYHTPSPNVNARFSKGYIPKLSVVLSLRGAQRRSNLVWPSREIASLPPVARNDRLCRIYRRFWDIPFSKLTLGGPILQRYYNKPLDRLPHVGLFVATGQDPVAVGWATTPASITRVRFSMRKRTITF
jgi:hypothetical protein